MTAPPIPVVFIHGLWIHSDAWQPWIELYRSAPRRKQPRRAAI